MTKKITKNRKIPVYDTEQKQTPTPPLSPAATVCPPKSHRMASHCATSCKTTRTESYAECQNRHGFRIELQGFLHPHRLPTKHVHQQKEQERNEAARSSPPPPPLYAPSSPLPSSRCAPPPSPNRARKNDDTGKARGRGNTQNSLASLPPPKKKNTKPTPPPPRSSPLLPVTTSQLPTQRKAEPIRKSRREASSRVSRKRHPPASKVVGHAPIAGDAPARTRAPTDTDDAPTRKKKQRVTCSGIAPSGRARPPSRRLIRRSCSCRAGGFARTC